MVCPHKDYDKLKREYDTLYDEFEVYKDKYKIHLGIIADLWTASDKVRALEARERELLERIAKLEEDAHLAEDKTRRRRP